VRGGVSETGEEEEQEPGECALTLRLPVSNGIEHVGDGGKGGSYTVRSPSTEI